MTTVKVFPRRGGAFDASSSPTASLLRSSGVDAENVRKLVEDSGPRWGTGMGR